MKQSLAIAYSTKRGNRKKKPQSMCEGGSMMAEGGEVNDMLPLDGPAGRKARREAPEDEKGKELRPHMREDEWMDGERPAQMAEGGAVDDMRPLHAEAEEDENEKLHPSMESGRNSNIDPGLSQEEDSDLQEDLPRVAESLSLAAEIMQDRKRLRMSKGGYVSSMGSSSLVGDLHQGVEEPTMSDLDNDSDELDAPTADGRWQRGRSGSAAPLMADDHNAGDASLVEQILRERKLRRKV